VIDLAEHVRTVHGIGVDPGCDRHAFVANLRESGIDNRNVLRSDGDDARLVERLALEIREIEGAVPAY
jgi:hypothetical protein